MASWTDKTTPTFTPYVAQSPVEAMVKVGMQKQEQYNQGYQKIQDSIDRVAGLDVVREVDKVHLQGKLNELGGKLKTVAAGDFSNFQLANSVANMAGNLIQDPDIQNAVISTQKYRQSVAEMQQARKAGKSSPSNEYIFNRDANNWLQGPREATFDAQYNPYVDVKKEGLEILKALSPSGQVSDNAFNPDGSLNMAVIRSEMKGVSPQKIQQALLVGLSPGARRQLQIDGQYKYANKSGEELLETIGISSSQQLKELERKKVEIEGMLPSTTNAQRRADLYAQIDAIDAQTQAINTSYTSMVQTFLEDPESADAIRAQLETENFISNFANAFSYTEHSQTLHNNPYVGVEMQKAKMRQDLAIADARMKQADRHHNDNYLLKQAQLASTNRANQLKYEELYGVQGGTPREVRKGEVSFPTYNMIKAEIDGYEEALQTQQDVFLKATGKSVEWYLQQQAMYEDNRSGVSGAVRDHFDTIEAMAVANKSKQAMIATVDAESQQEYATQTAAFDASIAALPSLTLQSNGGEVTFSPQEVLEFGRIQNNYISTETTPGGGGMFGGSSQTELVFDNVRAQREMSPKQFALFQIEQKNYRGEELSDQEKALKEMSDTIVYDYSLPFKKVLDEKAAHTEKLLKERMALSQGADYIIPAHKPVLRQQLGGLISSMVERAEGPGALVDSPDFDLETAQKLISDPQLSGTIFVADPTAYTEGLYKIKAVGKDGATVEFKAPADVVKANFEDAFDSPVETQFANRIKEQILNMNNRDKLGRITGSTSTMSGQRNDSNPVDAFIRTKDFPSIKLYGVTGDIETSDGVNYYLKLNIKDPLNPTAKNWNLQLNKDGKTIEDLLYLITNLRDDSVHQLLHGRVSEQDMKLLEEAVKQ